MKPSPIQLLNSTLLKVNIDYSEDEKFNESYYTPADFEKISIKTVKTIDSAPDFWAGTSPPIEGMEKRTYAIQLGIKSGMLPNGEGEWSPYRFEIIFGAVVAVVREEDQEKSEKLAFQYGLQFAFGSIRDLLLSLTCRMQHGQMLLPTMSFMDEVPDKPAKLES